MLSKLKQSRGFTLIEVVIVLAIAALIILVVLQAVAAAQRSQRDTTRKNEAGQIISMMEQYASNNQGRYPNRTGTSAALTPYDPSGNVVSKYTFSGVAAMPAACPVVTAATYTIYYQTSTATSPRSYQLAVCLEAGGLSVVSQ